MIQKDFLKIILFLNEIRPKSAYGTIKKISKNRLTPFLLILYKKDNLLETR